MVSTPSPPDPVATATAQGQANTQGAIASSVVNNPNEITPFGTVKYNKAGSQWIKNPDGTRQRVPRYNRVTKLSKPEKKKYHSITKMQQGLLGIGKDQINRIDQSLSTPLTVDGPDMVRGVDGPGAYERADLSDIDIDPQAGLLSIQGDYGVNPNQLNRAAKQTQQALLSRINPEMERQRKSLESQLTSQGLVRGTEAFQNAMDEHLRQNNDLQMQAVLAGQQEQSRLLGEARAAAQFSNQAQAQEYAQSMAALQARQQGQTLNNNQRLAQAQQRNQTTQQEYQDRLSQAEFANQARQQQLQENAALRASPINEISAFMNGSQVSVPQGQNFYRQGIAPAPVMDATYRSYEAERQNSMAAMSGLFGLGSSLLGALPMFLSDEDAKTKKKKVGKAGGLDIYEYEYKGVPGEKHVGPMAQDVQKQQPDAVVEEPNTGLLMIDMSKFEWQ